MPDTVRFDAAQGRYVHLPLTSDGESAPTDYRVYFEETGSGDVGLLLQHTAGADGRQWRHVLEDEELQSKFRMVAYDLPCHGKSVPPEGEQWWRREYRLTREFLMSVPLAPYTPGGFNMEFYHPEVNNDFKAHVMYGMMAPTSPEALRRETAWVYSQGAPAVFRGDLYYYSVDHDVRNTAATIDTNVCSVDILNGEYDWSGTPAGGEELAAMIPGARYRTMEGLGHFPMSEHPQRFLKEIRPVLDRILTGAAA